jgi:hypothetical protein
MLLSGCPSFQMSALPVRFNALAINEYVPTTLFTIDRPMRILMVGQEAHWNGSHIVLYVDMGEGAMGRIFVPKPLHSAFTLGDFYMMNSGQVTYDLVVRRHPLYHDKCHFQHLIHN